MASPKTLTSGGSARSEELIAHERFMRRLRPAVGVAGLVALLPADIYVILHAETWKTTVAAVFIALGIIALIAKLLGLSKHR